MSIIDPIFIDKQFTKVQKIIDFADSFAVKMHYLQYFFGLVSGYEAVFESYLYQLISKLKRINQSIEISGIDPKYFENFILQIEKILYILSDETLSSRIRPIVNEYKIILDESYQWVGVSKKTNQYVNNLISTVKEDKSKYDEEMVLVPVLVEIDNVIKGRLTRFSIRIISESERMEVYPTFQVIGAKFSYFFEDIIDAVDQVLNEILNKRKKWQYTLSNSTKEFAYKGRSGHLAIAAAMICETLKAEHQRERFWLNPKAVITGDIRANGEVIFIDSLSLGKKVKAAFFSTANVLVVPLIHLEDVQNYVFKLREEYPKKIIQVVGIQNIRDLFYDRRIIFSERIPSIRFHMKKLKRSKSRVMGSIVFFILTVLLAYSWYGPIDKNPSIISYNGKQFEVKNKKGVFLFEKYGGFSNSAVYSEYYSKNFADLVDFDNDFYNEYVWLSLHESDTLSSYMRLNYADNTGQELWSRYYYRFPKYDFHPYIQNSVLHFNKVTHSIENNDGVKVILALGQIAAYFPSYIFKINPNTGDVIEEILYPGHLKSITTDFKNNSRYNDVVFLGGVNNEFKKASLLVIDESSWGKQIAIGDKYRANNIEMAKPLGHFLFPKSILTNQIQNMYGYQSSVTLINKVNYSETQYMVHVSERYFEDGKEKSIFLVYTFDKTLNVVNVASSTEFDLLAQQFYDSGKIDIYPDGKYLQTYKDSVIRLKH